MADLKFQAYIQIEIGDGKTIKGMDTDGNQTFILTVPEADIPTFTGFDLSNVATVANTYGEFSGTATSGLDIAYTNANTDDPVIVEFPIGWKSSYSKIRNEIKQSQITNVRIIVERLDWHTSDEVE